MSGGGQRRGLYIYLSNPFICDIEMWGLTTCLPIFPEVLQGRNWLNVETYPFILEYPSFLVQFQDQKVQILQKNYSSLKRELQILNYTYFHVALARDIDLHIVSSTYVTVHEPSTLTPNSRAVKKKMHRKKEHFQELVNRGLTNSVMYTNKQD